MTGLAALGGGAYGMAGAEGVPVEWLKGTPFSSYFVPSLVLFTVVGAAHVLGGVAVWSGRRSSRRLAAAASAILLGWIAAQVLVIGYVSWLQPTMAAVGGLGLLLASRIEAR